jgi:hypothetical protein
MRNLPHGAEPAATSGLKPTTLKVLIRLCFGERAHEFVNSLAVQHRKIRAGEKDFTGELFVPQ